MNRRLFLKRTSIVAASFLILPSATTYIRKWKFPKRRISLADAMAMVDPDEGLLVVPAHFSGRWCWFLDGEIVQPNMMSNSENIKGLIGVFDPSFQHT